MDFEARNQIAFLGEMLDTVSSATEIFNHILLNKLLQFFNIRNALITCFGAQSEYVSITDRERIYFGDEHPYAAIAANDPCAHLINQQSRAAHMWYDDLSPKVYRSSDLIATHGSASEHINFLRTVLHTQYMVIMPFSINGVLHLCIYKDEGEDDFSDAELEQMEVLYHHIALTLRSFKELERERIVSKVKDEIFDEHEDAYVICGIDHKILSCTDRALELLARMYGCPSAELDIEETEALFCFLTSQAAKEGTIQTTTMNNLVFQIHPFPISYVHGAIELYHWITLHQAQKARELQRQEGPYQALTRREQAVAELLYAGLSYQEIASELVISFHTVKNHVQHILAKYGVSTRYQFYQRYQKKSV